MEKGKRILHDFPILLVNCANGKRKRTIAISTNLNSTVRDNISNVFGAKKVQNLLDFDISLEKEGISGASPLIADQKITSSIKGFMSRASIGSNSASDRQLYYVNSRPCHLPQVSKSFNEIYKNFNLHFSPFIFANLHIDSDRYEVRTLPGKTTVHLHDEQELLETLKTSLSLLLRAQPLSFSQSARPSRAPSAKQQNSREENASTLLEDATYQKSEPYERNANVQGSGEKIQEAFNVPNDEKHDSDAEEGTSDENCESPAVPSRAKRKEQGGEVGSNIKASRVKSYHSLATKVHHDSEENSDFRGGKRPRLETFVSNESDPTSDSTLLRRRPVESAGSFVDDIDSEIGHIQPSYAEDTQSMPPALEPEIPGTARVESKKDIAQQKQSWNRLRTERLLVKPGTTGHKPGFILARNHHDILQLQERGGEDSGDVAAGNDTFNKGDDPDQEVRPADEVLAVRQSDNGKTPVVMSERESMLEEREHKAYQDSKVSSLIAKAEEAVVISSKNLRIRAISTLNVVHKSGILMQPVRQLVFKPFLGENGAKSFTNMPRSDMSNARSEVKELENKVDSLSLSKSEFANMRVIGQFNLGFVLTATMVQAAAAFSPPDVFIIDQHASDEIYNFETFENTLSITSQRLAHPQSIELTAVEEELVSRYDNVLLKNGFKLSQEHADPIKNNGQRRLVGLPSLGGVLYNKGDFQELLNILGENYEGKIEHKLGIPRPAKTRKILSMKACRSSIMIGKPLSKNLMEQIVLQMGQIDKPWHCPHGRPTIKYLSSLNKFRQWREGDGVVGVADGRERPRRTDWLAYLR